MRKEKICLICKEEYSNRGTKCTPCYQAEYHKINKEQISVKKRKYYESNKDLILERRKEYDSKNRDKKNTQSRKHYQLNKKSILKYQKTIRNTPKRKYSQGVKSAKDRNLLWTIDFVDYVQIITQPCHYCKTSLEKWGGSSLDRVDNSLGYMLINVLPCCGTCNNIRNNFLSVKEMEVAMAAVVEFRKGEIK